ncbi:helicase [Kickxella alabastrina]|uniref:Helicase n=1 Tax=Kickxella alabastrina TaxID=61397 RepID=A0ACC1I325_9FUNG|nr:helicase [Kickxella alabastrina]
MREHAEPEILRTPLEQVSLQAKALGHSDSLQFMQRLLTPPEPAAAHSAELLLVALGACDRLAGPLGALGRLMAEIPVDLRLAKMLVYAAVFGCLDRALVLAALMAHDKPLFAAPFEKRDEAQRERMRFAVDGHGDWIADLCAYEYVAGQRGQLDFVSRAVMRDVRNSVRSLREALAFTGLSEPPGPPGPPGPSDPLKITRGGADPMVLRAVVFAGLSPSIARVRVPKQKYYEVVGGAVGIDREAREMAFYAVDPLGPSPKCAQRWQGHDMRADRRVFIHPQSTMFSENRYAVPFVTFFALTQSGAQKTYMRDVTVPGMYALLLFGPQLVVDPENKVVCVGPTGGLAVRAWPRVAVLVNQLRSLLDELLRRKLDDPSLRIAAHPVVEAVLELIRTDGK